jgi:hypothetical protein
MDIRTPDSYTTETLVDSNHSTQDSSQDISCHELELALLQSMEEAWTKEAQCVALWASFQPFLERLKRIGYYEPEYRKIYELLSIHLYKYAYQVEDTLSEETSRWIEQSLIRVRLSKEEREQIDKALTHLRSTQLRSTHPRS